MSDIENEVIQITRETLGKHPLVEIASDSALVDELGADSLDKIELAMGVEEAFGIDMIPDDTAQSWDTVSDIIETVEEANNDV